MNTFSFAIGIATSNNQGDWLEAFYPQPLLNPNPRVIECLKTTLGYKDGNEVITASATQLEQLAEQLTAIDPVQAKLAKRCATSSRPVVITVLETDSAPQHPLEVYLKLHLLSHRLVKPHSVNLTGMFGLLANVAWTNQGAVDLNELADAQFEARKLGQLLEVNCVDKFPKMTDYVVPKGVRIADTSRVRLGAYIGEGTTVMHEGFVNFNAGTMGTGMIEGRISAGVVVEEGSDLGGGCSTMGTLSGGNNVIISIGEGCLIGANAGVGIPLGDRCTVEAGLYVTAGAKVNILDEQKQLVTVTAARNLASKSDLLFRRNSQTGALECLANKSAIQLNEELHANN